MSNRKHDQTYAYLSIAKNTPIYIYIEKAQHKHGERREKGTIFLYQQMVTSTMNNNIPPLFS